MMNRIGLILFGTVSTIAVFILLISLYQYANENDKVISANDGVNDYTNISSVKKKEKRGWLDNLAIKKKPTFSYAVTEVEIALPLKKSPKLLPTFRLILEDIDNYKMFCVKRIFIKNKINYSLYKKNDRAVIIINDLNKNQADHIVKILKNYHINTKIENYIKE